MLCEDLQREEYEVLKAIYPECVSSEITNNSLRLEIPVEFREPRTVYVQDEASAAQSSSQVISSMMLSLSSLPPITLTVILPTLYPMENPPTITSIRASHFWLPHITQLQKVLTDIWQPGEGVLYNWIEFVRSGEFLKALSLSDDNNVLR
ncbi:hypothetical protein DXG01_000020 [Tephrocybe rancida]|nr:hypothetical protein DXG01_000020 [Tephrocybe rancida]